MGHIDERITHRIRDRIQEILVADGVADVPALTEANSLCDGLGYYHQVRSSTGLRMARAYDGVEIWGPDGTLVEQIPFERTEDYF